MKLRLLLLLIVGIGAQGAVAGEQKEPIHLTLSSALERARGVSIGILVSEARVEGAIARLGQARSSLLPQISADGIMARQTRDMRGTGIQLPGADPHMGPFNSLDARLRITQSLFDAASLQRWRAAKAGEELSSSQMQKARQDSLALVGTMFIEARRSQQHFQLTKILLKRDKKALELAEAKLKQGTGTTLDVKKAKAEYAQSKYLYASAAADAQAKRLDIYAALKIPSDVAVYFDEEKISLGKTVSSGDVKPTPDVKVAEDQVKAQKADASAVKSEYLPKVSAFGDYGRAGESARNSSNTYSVGLKATVPIWEGGSKQAKVKEAAAKLKEAEAILEDTRLKSDAEIEKAKADIEEAKALIEAKKMAVASAREEKKLAKQRLTLGTGYELDVDIADAKKALAEDEQGEAMALLWIAKINLAHALGRMDMLHSEAVTASNLQ